MATDLNAPTGVVVDATHVYFAERNANVIWRVPKSTATVIVDLSTQAAPRGLVCDVLVIGSGSGGATAARVLAEAGREVVVLEEGADRTGKDLTQRDGAMYDQLYMDRGGRVTAIPPSRCCRGACWAAARW